MISIPRFTPVRFLEPGDVNAVVERVAANLAGDARRSPFVNPVLDREVLARALLSATSHTWVAYWGDEIVGHLYGALLSDEPHGRGAWVGPDGASFDNLDILAVLYAKAGERWIDAGAREHYVWTLDHPIACQPWYEMGFARMHVRGVLALDHPGARSLPAGYHLRRGSIADLELAIELTAQIDRAQEAGPSFALGLVDAALRDDLIETLGDPEVSYHVVERDGRGVAQCVSYPLPTRRGSFDTTLHLSAVAVREEHRGYGVGVALIDAVLAEARAQGFGYAETNWRVTNRRAANFWQLYGFTPTYVRLHRSIGAL